MTKLSPEQQETLQKFCKEHDDYITKFITVKILEKTSNKDGKYGFVGKINKEDIDDIKQDFYLHFFQSSGKVRQFYKQQKADAGKVHCKDCRFYYCKDSLVFCNHDSNSDKINPAVINEKQDCANFDGKMRYKWSVNDDTKGKDFLQIYDAKKSKFSTFLASLMQNQIKRFFQKRKVKIVKEKKGHEHTLMQFRGESDLIYSENYDKDNYFHNEMEREIMLREQLYDISMKLLNEGLIGFVYDDTGRLIDRGLLNVWQLLREGYKKNEIASMLHYSNGRITQLIKELRAVREIIEYRNLLAGN